jgi:hypothetical protein
LGSARQGRLRIRHCSEPALVRVDTVIKAITTCNEGKSPDREDGALLALPSPKPDHWARAME